MKIHIYFNTLIHLIHYLIHLIHYILMHLSLFQNKLECYYFFELAICSNLASLLVPSSSCYTGPLEVPPPIRSEHTWGLWTHILDRCSTDGCAGITDIDVLSVVLGIYFRLGHSWLVVLSCFFPCMFFALCMFPCMFFIYECCSLYFAGHLWCGLFFIVFLCCLFVPLLFIVHARPSTILLWRLDCPCVCALMQ